MYNTMSGFYNTSIKTSYTAAFKAQMVLQLLQEPCQFPEKTLPC